MQKIALFFTFFILSGCFPQAPAPIEFKSMGSSSGRRVSDESFSSSSSGIKKRQIKMVDVEEPKPEQEKYDSIAEARKNEKPFETIKEVKEEIDTKSLEDEMSEAESKAIEEAPKTKKKEVGDIISPEVVPATNNVYFSRPVGGDIISKFGEYYMGKKNNGINIAAISGSDVKSVSDGVVIFAGEDPKFGNLIIIKHDTNDLFSAYAHMKDLKLHLQDRVTRSQIIGHVGQTGDVTKPQLHFAIRKGKTPVDPMQYLK